MKTIDLFEQTAVFDFGDGSIDPCPVQNRPSGTLIEQLFGSFVSVESCKPCTESGSSVLDKVEDKPEAKKPAKNFSEREWILEQAAKLNTEGILVLHKLDSNSFFVDAIDSLGMLLLDKLQMSKASTLIRSHSIQNSKPNHKENERLSGLDGCKPHHVKYERYGHRKIYSVDLLMEEEYSKTSFFKLMKGVGATVIIAPSLANWLKKERVRRERLMTPFQLNNTVDQRPLSEKLEIGATLECIKPYNNANVYIGHTYIVSSMPSVYESDYDEASNKSNVEAEIVDRYGNTVGKLNLLDNLDAYFKLSACEVKVYDPSKCLPAVYPHLIKQNTKKLEDMKLPLFDHVKFDVVQEAAKNTVFNGKMMRMGKTSESLAWAMLRGSKKVAYIGPKNGRGVVASEMKRLGRPDDCAMINKLSDLEKHKDVWLELLTYDWIKRTEDPFRKTKAKKYSPFAVMNCPKCEKEGHTSLLQRFVNSSNPNQKPKWSWIDYFGYRCRRKGCGYVDYERANYVEYEINTNSKYYENDNFYTGRQASEHVFHSVWIPPRYRRIKKRYKTIIVDEIHMIKDWSTQQTKAVFSMKAKNRFGMTGTLMPNSPSDPYWPLHWIFGGKNYRFPYMMHPGLSRFNDQFTQSVVVENDSTGTSYVKKIPYLKSPQKFWDLLKDKMVRRTYDDPLVVESFAKAGLVLPEVDRKLIVVEPGIEQATLLMASMTNFEEQFNKYVGSLSEKSLKSKTKESMEEAKNYIINSSYVLGQMLLMRIAATCPGHLNDRFGSVVYKGDAGGAKMAETYELVKERAEKKEKVVILSDFCYNQKLLEARLAEFKPIRFRTDWSDDKRIKAIEAFQEKDENLVFIAGPRAIGLAVDLSAARTCICTDLLWTPGMQQQAWSRILKPVAEKRCCEVLILATKFSIDKHIYDTFYSKLAAAEQALDRKILSKRDKVLDIKAFVDLVLNDRGAMLQWLIDSGEDELCYVPALDMLTSLEEREV